MRTRRERVESTGYYGNLEDPASQDEMGLLRTMRRTERKERRRTATPTLTSNTIKGDEVSGELTASTLLVLGWLLLISGSFLDLEFIFKEDADGNLVLQEDTREERATGDLLVVRKQEGSEGSRDVWRRSRVEASGQEHSQGFEETVTITWREGVCEFG